MADGHAAPGNQETTVEIRMNGIEQRVLLLVFTRYTATSLANERAVETLEASDGQVSEFHGPSEEDVFPAWADAFHTVDCGSGRRTRTNNLKELNELLQQGWAIRRMVPMHEGCACLTVLSRRRDDEQHEQEAKS